MTNRTRKCLQDQQIYIIHHIADTLRRHAPHALPIPEAVSVSVLHEGRETDIELLVADVAGQTPIWGRDWMTVLQLECQIICQVNLIMANQPQSLQGMLDKHKDIFKDGAGVKVTSRKDA